MGRGRDSYDSGRARANTFRILNRKMMKITVVWTLRKKIFIRYSLSLLLMVLVLIWAFVNLWNLDQASNAILKENYRSVLAAENMVYAIER